MTFWERLEEIRAQFETLNDALYSLQKDMEQVEVFKTWCGRKHEPDDDRLPMVEE